MRKSDKQSTKKAEVGRTQDGEVVGVDKEYNYCLRCGRPLKNPVARVCGYGAVCFIKMKRNNVVGRLF